MKAAAEGIRRTVAFYKELGMPTSLKEIGLENPTDEEIHVLAMIASYDKTITVTKIKPVDYEGIKTMFEWAKEGILPED